jgi:hypothetical protein
MDRIPYADARKVKEKFLKARREAARPKEIEAVVQAIEATDTKEGFVFLHGYTNNETGEGLHHDVEAELSNKGYVIEQHMFVIWDWNKYCQRSYD